MLKLEILFIVVILSLNTAAANGLTKTITEMNNYLNITISKKNLIISTRCRGIPFAPNQDLETCGKRQVLIKRVKNNSKLDKLNSCNQLQHSYQPVSTSCFSYCLPCKYKYTD